MFRPLACRILSSATAFTHGRVRIVAPLAAAGVARPAAFVLASVAAAGAAAAAQCEEEEDDADMPRLRAHRVQTKDLAEVRQVVRSISTKTGSEADTWVSRASAAFTSAARPDGTLGQEEVGFALQKLSLIQDQGLLWELGPLVFRLLDTERKGRVQLKDFLMGQALLFAAAKTGNGGHLGDACWLALDLRNTGEVTKQELAVTVNIMLHLGAVDPDDLRTIKAKAGAENVVHEKRGRGRHSTVLEQAVLYYMNMYDPQDSGHITREAFENCSRLQENFRRLLQNDQVMPMFLTHEAPLPMEVKL